MTITYARQIGRHYSKQYDEYFEEEYDFNYEPAEDDILEALTSILIGEVNFIELNSKEYEAVSKVVRQMITDLDLKEDLQERYSLELKEWFEDEALSSEGEY